MNQGNQHQTIHDHMTSHHRPREDFSHFDPSFFFPIWVHFFWSLSQVGTIQDLSRSLVLFLKRGALLLWDFHKIIDFSSLGELHLTFETFTSFLILSFLTLVVSPLLFLISCIPLLCVLYPLYSSFQCRFYNQGVRQRVDKEIKGKGKGISFFINGMFTTPSIAEGNRQAFSQIFRPGTPQPILLYNPTQGFLMDILECIAEKSLGQVSAPTRFFLPIIRDALRSEKERVTIFCHSQGCLITWNLLRLLSLEDGIRALMDQKLQVVTFGSPVSQDYVWEENLTHVANVHDVVAIIGVLNSDTIPEDTLYRKNRGGHILNHYLTNFPQGYTIPGPVFNPQNY